jgi:glycosyltransferase involved in cell wall biosynthesis
VHTLAFGNEPRPEAVPEAADPMFLALGRLVPHKRIDLLLDIWEHVRPATGGTLVIAGDGPERVRLERRAGEGVVFTGYVDEAEKHRLLGRAWLLLHPALHEGWGVAVMEAAAEATPTIGFDVIGVRDTVRPGSTGRLADDPTQFAKHWIDLTMDAAERARLGQGALAWARQGSWDHTIDQFLDVLQLSVASRSAAQTRRR